MSSVGNAAEQVPAADATSDEPSMDEILASIRQIIAEDEDGTGDAEARANYTHPTDHSNANANTLTEPTQETATVAGTQQAAPAPEPESAPVAGATGPAKVTPLSAADIEAAVARELANPTLTADPSANLADASTVPEVAAPFEKEPVVEAVASTDEDVTADSEKNAATPELTVPDNVHERAEKVREELGLTGTASAGMSLEHRLERYRVRGRMRAAERTAEMRESTQEEAPAPVPATPEQAQPAPVTAGPAVAPPPAATPTADQVAAAILNQTSGNATQQLQAMMQPLVRQWLSDNLPTLVERLVREEIERVSRGRTG